ncbi:thermonuclease family protein [Leucothrix sargassi]|nr:thermonuclease family protein [Leucothrix sargassi]
MAIRFTLVIFLSFVLSSAAVAGDCPGGLYTYQANVTSVYDGDTITADIDLGFHTWRKGEKLRLARIDAPEVRGKEKVQGKISRDWLREQVLGKKILIQTVKNKKGVGDQQGKYGRYLVELFVRDGDKCRCLNDDLVDRGYAVYKRY